MTTDLHLADALASIYDAAATRVPPWMALVTAIASTRPDGIGATIDWLVGHRAELEASFAAGGSNRLALPTMAPGMQYPQELGRMGRIEQAREDHQVRDRWLFAELAGRWSFMQSTIYVISGVELPRAMTDMLEEIATINLLLDRRAWPMAVTRRVGARGGSYAAAVVAGQAMMGGTVVAGAAAADCARFLRQARAAQLAGESVPALIAGRFARRERVMGFGRPVVGPDERVPIMDAVLARHGRDHLPHVELLREVEREFQAQRGLRSTSAAWAAAILLDLGLTPDHIEAVCNAWVSVCIYGQAAFSREHGLVDVDADADADADADIAGPPATAAGSS